MVFTLSGRMKAEEGAELKALFNADYRSIVLDLQRREAGRLRCSEVSKRLRRGWDEAGKLSGVPPRVEGKGQRLSVQRTGSPDLPEEVHCSDEYIFFGADG